jgi:hypothetical protein
MRKRRKKMPAKNHVHKYELVALGKDFQFPVYRCGDPDCTHYIQRTLAYGKKSICWRCGKEYILTKKIRDKRRPTCGCKPGILPEREDPEVLDLKAAQEAILELLGKS